MLNSLYAIRCKANRFVYIGITTDIKRRIKQHKKSLEQSTHYNSMLQIDYNHYGKEMFEFIVILTGEKGDYNRMEKDLIRYYSTKNLAYNITNSEELVKNELLKHNFFECKTFVCTNCNQQFTAIKLRKFCKSYCRGEYQSKFKQLKIRQ